MLKFCWLDDPAHLRCTRLINNLKGNAMTEEYKFESSLTILDNDIGDIMEVSDEALENASGEGGGPNRTLTYEQRCGVCG